MASDSVSGAVKPKVRATCWAWPAIAPWRCSTNLGELVVPEVVKMLQGARAEAWLPAKRGRDSRRSKGTRRRCSMAGGTGSGVSPTVTMAESRSSASGSMPARIDRKSMRRKAGAQASTLAPERPTMSATSTAR